MKRADWIILIEVPRDAGVTENTIISCRRQLTDTLADLARLQQYLSKKITAF